MGWEVVTSHVVTIVNGERKTKFRGGKQYGSDKNVYTFTKNIKEIPSDGDVNIMYLDGKICPMLSYGVPLALLTYLPHYFLTDEVNMTYDLISAMVDDIENILGGVIAFPVALEGGNDGFTTRMIKKLNEYIYEYVPESGLDVETSNILLSTSLMNIITDIKWSIPMNIFLHAMQSFASLTDEQCPRTLELTQWLLKDIHIQLQSSCQNKFYEIKGDASQFQLHCQRCGSNFGPILDICSLLCMAPLVIQEHHHMGYTFERPSSVSQKQFKNIHKCTYHFLNSSVNSLEAQVHFAGKMTEEKKGESKADQSPTPADDDPNHESKVHQSNDQHQSKDNSTDDDDASQHQYTTLYEELAEITKCKYGTGQGELSQEFENNKEREYMHDLVNCLRFDMNSVNTKIRDTSRARVNMTFLHVMFEFMQPATLLYNDHCRHGDLKDGQCLVNPAFTKDKFMQRIKKSQVSKKVLRAKVSN